MTYLDCDTTPCIKSRHARSLRSAKWKAFELLCFANEGQIGIYERSNGGAFYGYMIKYRGGTPFFEEPEGDQ